MALTQQQLETVKAANLAKSVSWEAAHFLPGEVVSLHGLHTATRVSNGWTCNQTNVQYETLSRWGRAKLNRAAFNPKYYVFLTVGSAVVPLSRLSPITERPVATQTPNSIDVSTTDMEDLRRRLIAQQELIESLKADVTDFKEHLFAIANAVHL
jgi:hypothetical protein